MALVQDHYCATCKETTQHINNECVVCMGEEKRLKELAWSKKTADEKIEDLRKRIEALEQKPAKY